MPGSDITGGDEPTWDFPELSGPDPTSLELPEPEPEPIYDTGSDGWWRQQAAAQKAAAERDPEPPVFTPPPAQLMPPLELVEPEVLNLPTGPSPFEEAYLPPAVPEPAPRPVLRPLLPDPGYDERPAAPAPPAWSVDPAPVVEEEPVAYQPAYGTFLDEGPAEPAFREDVLPDRSGGRDRVGFGKALAWAGLAIAGVGLIVLAFLLLGKGEPTGTPTVALPPVVTTTAPVASVAPTAGPSAEPTAETTTETTTAPAVVAPVVPVTVLNNSRITGLAKQAAAKFRAGGWPVPATGNYRGQVDTTTVYYPPGKQASAERFGKQFGVRVLPRFATLPGSGMTVVVTRDFVS
ncbi:MAG: hypothetical protein JWN31_2233 [Frankiales bacterium]|nr:hypothetical protein [Frankiales bacterium]